MAFFSESRTTPLAHSALRHRTPPTCGAEKAHSAPSVLFPSGEGPGNLQVYKCCWLQSDGHNVCPLRSKQAGLEQLGSWAHPGYGDREQGKLGVLLLLGMLGKGGFRLQT